MLVLLCVCSISIYIIENDYIFIDGEKNEIDNTDNAHWVALFQEWSDTLK